MTCDSKCVMMGHVHIPDARKWNGVLYVNPGSTEMKSSNEPHDKFWFVVDTDTWTAQEIPLETREVKTVEVCSEADVDSITKELTEEGKAVYNEDMPPSARAFYQIIADDSIEDVYKRLATVVHDTSAIARIVTRSSRVRDLAPSVDRKEEGISTLESAIEARFPKDSDEARLILSMLRSPDPSSVHMIVEKFMKGEQVQKT